MDDFQTTAKRFGLGFVKRYLKVLVGLLLSAKKPEIIAITGTAGKTTAKETVSAVLREKLGSQVAQTYSSLNTKTGVPIGMLGFAPNWINLGPAWWAWPWWLALATARATAFLLGIKVYPKIWVIELAADKPGDFDFLLSYIHPKIAIVTNIGIGHIQFFGSVEAVAKEKSRLVEKLSSDGVAVLNYNDERVRRMSQSTQAKVLWVRAKGINFAPTAARIIGRLFGLTYPQIERGLKKVKSPASRMDVLRGANDSIIIDSSYNANPISIAAALEVLADFPKTRGAKTRKIAVLGEMLELGRYSAKAHQDIYKSARLVADDVLTTGDGFKEFSNHHFDNLGDIVKTLLPTVGAGDIILIKGSHGTGLRSLVEALIK